jgi:C4-dicarboxylate-specific signal transduction histidine kinase
VQEFIESPGLFTKLIIDADRAAWDRHVAAEQTGRSPIQLRITTKDGQIRWIEHACNRVVGEAGESLGIRGSNRDITDRKEAEEALRKGELEAARAREEARIQREMLAHANRIAVMEGLASSLAHELNQPLTGILSNAQAAVRYLRAENPNVEELYAILRDIVADDKRAGEIIRRWRSFVRKEAPKYVPTDVNAVAREVVEIMTADAITKNIRIREDCAERLPKVLGDRVQLQQVLVNLITNSQQALEELAEDRREITVSTGVASDGDVVVEVRDRGLGIDLTKGDIFEPFFTTKRDGAGIGLSICRSLIESHCGLIWAENAPDGGACISFTLPPAGKQSNRD